MSPESQFGYLQFSGLERLYPLTCTVLGSGFLPVLILRLTVLHLAIVITSFLAYKTQGLELPRKGDIRHFYFPENKKGAIMPLIYNRYFQEFYELACFKWLRTVSSHNQFYFFIF